MKLRPGNQYEIGEYLVSEGVLTRKQLETVFSMQKSTGGSLVALVVKLGFAEEDALVAIIAKALGVEAVDLHSLVIPDVLARKIPREVLVRHQVLPVGMRGGALQLATSDPTDYAAVEEVQFLTDLTVEICLASRTAIQEALEEVMQDVERKRKGLDTFLMNEQAPDGAEGERYGGLSPADIQKALIPLLIDKGVLQLDELVAKARELRDQG